MTFGTLTGTFIFVISFAAVYISAANVTLFCKFLLYSMRYNAVKLHFSTFIHCKDDYESQ